MQSKGSNNRDLLWYIPTLFLPAARLVPHPGDKVPKVSSADSCTLVRRRRLRPRSWRHPPVNRCEPFVGSVSLSRQKACPQDTLQQHIVVTDRDTTCPYFNLQGPPPSVLTSNTICNFVFQLDANFFIKSIVFLYMFRAYYAHLQEDLIVSIQHLVPDFVTLLR